MRFDVAVIGGGIMGLAQAWMAARRGLKTLLIERSPVAQGASVRNFGMIWPIGQPSGECLQVALRSRELWLELQAAGAVAVEPCGSLHLAHREDELAVLEELCSRQTHPVAMQTPGEVLRQSNLVNPRGLLGGMHSPLELRVDPRVASARLAAWLAETQGVQCEFGTVVTAVDNGEIRAADGRRWQAGTTIVCSGSDLQTLYPDILQASGLRLCKLQMLRLAAQPLVGSRPHLASGLTLRHYGVFQDCQSLAPLTQRIQQETPELNRFGIHVMVSQAANGEVILGDSHEYDEQISPFDSSEIDDLILREARQVFHFAPETVIQRWHGIYAKHPERLLFETTAPDGTRICVGPGGAGMTLSLGLADRAWQTGHLQTV